MIVTYACEITETNVIYILEDLAKWNLNVSDDLDGAEEEAATYGNTSAIAIMSINYDLDPIQATFTTMWKTDFDRNFRYDGSTYLIWKGIKSR